MARRRKNPWPKGRSRRRSNAARKAWRTRKRKYGKAGRGRKVAKRRGRKVAKRRGRRRRVGRPRLSAHKKKSSRCPKTQKSRSLRAALLCVRRNKGRTLAAKKVFNQALRRLRKSKTGRSKVRGVKLKKVSRKRRKSRRKSRRKARRTRRKSRRRR